jgi:hypothetical protein
MDSRSYSLPQVPELNEVTEEKPTAGFDLLSRCGVISLK